MSGIPPIDDRRRFKELWKELLFARMLGSAAAALPLAIGGYWSIAMLNYLLTAQERIGYRVCGIAVSVVGLALPSCIARRGWRIGMMAAGSVAATILFCTGIKDLVPGVYDRAFIITLATAGAALGTVEGMHDGALDTLWCGLLGGAASGALSAGALTVLMLDFHNWLPGPGCYVASIVGWLLNMWASAAVLHLGIGLSLALGRYIRDLPKLKAGVDPGAD